MEQHEWAYLAGLFDGEGCVQIIQQKPKGSNVSGSYYLYIGIRNTDTAIVKWIHSKIGGNLQDSKSYQENRSRSWWWNLHCHAAYEFLKSVRPFLHIKAEEADIAMKFQEEMEEFKRQPYERKGVKRGRPVLPAEVVARRRSAM